MICIPSYGRPAMVPARQATDGQRPDSARFTACGGAEEYGIIRGLPDRRESGKTDDAGNDRFDGRKQNAARRGAVPVRLALRQPRERAAAPAAVTCPRPLRIARAPLHAA